MVGILATRLLMLRADDPEMLEARVNRHLRALEADGGEVMSLQFLAPPVAVIGDEQARFAPAITVYTAWIVYRAPVAEEDRR